MWFIFHLAGFIYATGRILREPANKINQHAVRIFAVSDISMGGGKKPSLTAIMPLNLPNPMASGLLDPIEVLVSLEMAEDIEFQQLALHQGKTDSTNHYDLLLATTGLEDVFGQHGVADRISGIVTDAQWANMTDLQAASGIISHKFFDYGIQMRLCALPYLLQLGAVSLPDQVAQLVKALLRHVFAYHTL